MALHFTNLVKIQRHLIGNKTVVNSNPTNLLIRQLQELDIPEIMSAWEKAFRLAHPFIEDAFIDKQKIDIPTLYIPNTETWVCEVQGSVVGFIALMGNEVAALFVDPVFHGKGIGRSLVNKAREIRDGDLSVDVFEENSIGRKFYAKYGFEYDSEYLFEDVGKLVLKLKLSS